MWHTPLANLAEELAAEPATTTLTDATIPTDGASSAPLAPLPCVATLRLGGASGFELTFQAAPDTRAMTQLVNGSFGNPPEVLMLKGQLNTGERLTARCKHLTDGHFDLQNNIARGAFTSLYIEIEAPPDRATGVACTELVVGSPAWLPTLPVRFDDRGLLAAPVRRVPSIELPTLHLEHGMADGAVVVRLLGAHDVHPDGAIGTVLDAMSFIAGCRLFPQFARQRVDDGAILRVFRRRESSTSRMSPIPLGDGEVLSSNAWQLFAALYTFLERQPEPPGYRCALTRAMAEVHGALRAEYVSTKALIVSIAVETLRETTSLVLHRSPRSAQTSLSIGPRPCSANCRAMWSIPAAALSAGWASRRSVGGTRTCS